MIKNEGIRNFFDGLYHECARSRQTQSAKSTQIMTIYLAMVAAYCTCLSTFSIRDFKAWIALGAFVTMFGIGCIASLLSLRSWKIQYTRCCTVLGQMIICDDQLESYNEIINFIVLHYKTTKLKPRSKILKGLDNKIILAFSVIVLFPLFFILVINTKWDMKYIIILAVILILYITSIIELLYRTEKKAYKRDMTWIIDFSGVRTTIQPKANAPMAGRNIYSKRHK